MTLLYPERIRCRKCRRFFGFLVVEGLFCSYGCAGRQEPSTSPADWPREHRTSNFVEKHGWFSLAEAGTAARLNGKDAYLCSYCGAWHIGSKAGSQARRFPSLEEYLRAFELKEWGTNRMDEIQEKIRFSEWEKAQAQMTGMSEEQADWEEE